MPLIWAAISGHGYGHAAQVVPVLNALGSLVPDLTAILRTSVPASFFHDRLKIRWTMQSVQQDIGCIQQGPLQIDVAGTWDAHDRFHEQWQERLKKEVDALQAVRPRVILADTPYLAISAGWEVGIPAVGLANFLWNEVLEPLADSGLRRHHDLLADIRRCYGRAEHALRIAPGLPLTAVSGVTDIGPIAEPALPRRGAIRAHLGIAESERLVLVGFGGVALESLPWNAMAEMKGHCFIVDCEIPTRHPRMVAAADLPYPFKTLL
ncbi:MAG TPA: hypothetical protein VIU63_11200, partial [Nitrospira sp.]